MCFYSKYTYTYKYTYIRNFIYTYIYTRNSLKLRISCVCATIVSQMDNNDKNCIIMALFFYMASQECP